eukprot:SAG11_NODE_3166_length_2640_cov_1.548996_2_plen_734_part_01
MATAEQAVTEHHIFEVYETDRPVYRHYFESTGSSSRRAEASSQNVKTKNHNEHANCSVNLIGTQRVEDPNSLWGTMFTSYTFSVRMSSVELQLERLELSQLQKHARRCGCSQDQIEQAVDSDDPKSAVTSLITSHDAAFSGFTSASDWEVTMRFSELCSVRDELMAQNVAVQVELPPKTVFATSHDLQHRQLALPRFLEGLLRYHHAEDVVRQRFQLDQRQKVRSIQRIFRGGKVRKYVAGIRRQHRAATTLQSIYRTHAVRNLQEHRHRTAVILQVCYRAHAAKRELAATSMQASFRGYAQRNAMAKLAQHTMRIQRQWRGCHDRARFECMVAADELAVCVTSGDAARLNAAIQAAERQGASESATVLKFWGTYVKPGLVSAQRQRAEEEDCRAAAIAKLLADLKTKLADAHDSHGMQQILTEAQGLVERHELTRAHLDALWVICRDRKEDELHARKEFRERTHAPETSVEQLQSLISEAEASALIDYPTLAEARKRLLQQKALQQSERQRLRKVLEDAQRSKNVMDFASAIEAAEAAGVDSCELSWFQNKLAEMQETQLLQSQQESREAMDLFYTMSGCTCVACHETKLSNEFWHGALTSDCEHPSLRCLHCLAKAWAVGEATCPDCGSVLSAHQSAAVMSSLHSLQAFHMDEADMQLGVAQNLLGGTLFVSDLAGNKKAVEFNITDTVADLKRAVAAIWKVPVAKQRLSFNRIELQGSALLQDHSITDHSV